MKTYFKDFSMADNSLVVGHNDLEEVIDNRQEKFRHTQEYQETREEVREALRKIISLSPETREKIEDAFFAMETICYSAAYKDGMSDLMAAMTFNKLGLTKVEYLDFRKGA